MTEARTTTSPPTLHPSPARHPKTLLWVVVAVMVIAIATLAVILVSLSGRGSPAPGPANPPISTVQHHNRSNNNAYNENCLPSHVMHFC